MQLIEIHYKDENWELKDFFLQETNLIVGKNASGKSRTLQLIFDLAQCILGSKEISDSMECKIKWIDEEKNVFEYQLFAGDKVETKETLYVGNKLLFRTIFQNYDSAYMTKVENGGSMRGLIVKHMGFRYVAHNNTDLTKIYTWAQTIVAFKFANLLPQNALTNSNTDKLTTILEVKLMLDNLPLSSFEKIKQEIISVGYELEDFKIRGGALFIKTPNIKRDLSLEELSQGMFRTLMLLMYWEYLATNQSVSAFLIDDLCEGLDFERAKKLGKLLFEKAKERDIQLITSSNDTFLMEVVGLEAFQVLIKEGNIVQSINSTSQPKIFDDFEYIGSTNFDLFSSNFIQNKLKA